MQALLIANLLVAVTVQIASSHEGHDGPGHPEDHSHPSNATFLYHDYYARANEGDTVELCARLNHPIDEELMVYYTTESANDWTAEEQDYESIYGTLVFEPGSQKKCFSIDTLDDDHAGEEDLEAFGVYWKINDTDVYFYDSNYDNKAYSVVTIKDDDVLTLTPDKNSVTVYEGDYAEVCVSTDELERDSATVFYVLYDDKHYTADIHHDLEYAHYDDYDDFYHYGGIKTIHPNESQACFHFHAYDDDKFEGNEEFAIKLFSFSPLNHTEIEDIDNQTFIHGYHPFFDAFHHQDFNHDQHDDHDGKGDHHSDHDHHDKDNCDYDYDYDYYDEDFIKKFIDKYAYYYSELYTHNTRIPYSVSTIRVTIVDNDPAPCLSKDGEACKQVVEDALCLLLQKKGNKNIKDLPRPCRKPGGKLLGKFLRYDPHPNQNDNI